jgi:hypothetical protein
VTPLSRMHFCPTPALGATQHFCPTPALGSTRHFCPTPALGSTQHLCDSIACVADAPFLTSLSFHDVGILQGSSHSSLDRLRFPRSSARAWCSGLNRSFARGVLVGFTMVLGLKPSHAFHLRACLSGFPSLTVTTMIFFTTHRCCSATVAGCNQIKCIELRSYNQRK